MDAGCGPGFASFELAELVGDEGRMTSFDGQENYLAYLDSQIKKRSISNIAIQNGDLLETGFPGNHFDFIFTRMVLIYISNLKKVLGEFERILKPGGMLLISDFYSYNFTVNRDSPSLDNIISLVLLDFQERSADLEIGRKITRLLKPMELEIEDMKTESRVAFSDNVAWKWPEGILRNYLPDMLQRKKVSQKQVEDFWREWEQLSSDPFSCLVTPTFVNILARKPQF